MYGGCTFFNQPFYIVNLGLGHSFPWYRSAE
jgi:hypothetical protein